MAGAGKLGQNLRIDGARLWDSLMEMAKIGPGVAGGNNRQTLTDADGEGRRLFKAWCDAAGLEKASINPGRDEVATITEDQVAEIAKTKMPDLNANDLEAAKAQVAGTARSMGIGVV